MASLIQLALYPFWRYSSTSRHQSVYIKAPSLGESRNKDRTTLPLRRSFFPLNIGGALAPTLFTFLLIAPLILLSVIGSTGPVRIMTTRLICRVGTHRGIIVILFGAIFWALWVSLFGIILEFGRLLCRVIVIRRGCPIQENGQSGCRTRDLLWFPPMLLGKIFICSANHASAPSNQIQGTFLMLLSHTSPNPETSPGQRPTVLQ